ncbi:MAG: hypothetical protein IKJ73_09930 [Lachnospiraceae bacterium]|nr:hypothetical protein [Lachnospiraceae bacterium]
MYLNYLLCIFIIFSVCLLCGRYIYNKVIIDSDVNYLIIGWLFLVGGFSVISIPFLFLHTRFDVLYYLYLVVVGIITIISIMDFIKTYNKLRLPKVNTIALLCFGVISIQIILALILSHGDADDSYYLAISNTVIDSNRIFVIDPSTGNENFVFQSQYEMVGHEVLIGVASKFFNINPAALCHTILPVFLIILHYAVAYEICKRISEKNKWYCLLFVVLANTFSGYSVYSRGAFLLFRIWQGKAVLTNIVIPLLLLLFWDVYKAEEVKKKDILILTLCAYCAFNTTSVGLYLFPLAYAIYTLTYLIVKRNVRNCLMLCTPMICSLPFLVMKLYLMQGTGVEPLILPDMKIVYSDVLKNINGSGYFMYVVILAVVINIIFGKDKHRYLLGIYPILCVVTFLNPLICQVVAEKITGIWVYWRLFWTLQMTFIIVGALSIIMDWLKSKRILILFMFGVIIFSCGKNIYTRDNFDFALNAENISDTSKNVVDCLKNRDEESIKLMLPLEYAIEIRQYTGEVQLVYSRYVRSEYLLNDDLETYSILQDIYSRLFTLKEYNDSIIEDLRLFETDYVGVYADADNTCFEKYECIYSDEFINVYDISN